MKREGSMMKYKTIDKETYYRKGVYHHFTQDCKCSTSMTARIDVTALAAYSKQMGTKFYLNFLYILSKVLNSRDDYRMAYLWQTDELICYDVIHPTQYVFHEDTETCTPVYTEFREDYDWFYCHALEDVENAKQTREYGLDTVNHSNWFDASYISWLSYDSLNIELPDGYLYFLPIINWGKYREENGRLLMPVSVRMNHAVADGYLIANVFRLLEKEIADFVKRTKKGEKFWTDTPLKNPCQAVSADAAAVAAIACELWPEHSAEEMAEKFKFLLAREDAAVFLYREQGEIVGFAQCQLRRDYVEGTETSPVGYLEGIYVRENIRRHGIARKLLAACESWAKAKGCTVFASDCECDNTDSQRFHQAVGLEEANRIVAFVKKL